MKIKNIHHPHLDPRYPRHGDAPRTNPPVFVWRPSVRPGKYRLSVARDPAFTDLAISIDGLADPVHLPEKAMEPGEYWWKWSTKASESTVFSFTIEASAIVFEVPPISVWLARFPEDRPRLYTRPNMIAEIRRRKDDTKNWKAIRKEADSILEEVHELDEPDYLPDRTTDYPAFRKAFFSAMWDSRNLARGAEILALAWLATGDEKYSRACRLRLLSLCSWDPDGPTSIENNDEAHMSILWYGVSAADWVWNQFSPEQKRKVLKHIGARVQRTFEHMHDRGIYGIERFDSHAGREIVFLGWALLAFHESIPGAEQMLSWLRPVLCGIWPVWASDDGSWAEGISYSLAYVSIMSRFAYILERGAAINLFTRPFWKGHAEWRFRCLPPYAEWIGFGDHTETWRQTWLRNADLVELIDARAGLLAYEDYVAELRSRAATLPERANTVPYLCSPMSFFSEFEEKPDRAQNDTSDQNDPVLRLFPDAGWASIRTNTKISDKDVCMIFRSSPYGSISHSHANNNDFIIHVAGTVMAMPSGYYSGYGSPHHASWVWHTKSHTCPTLSGASQKMRSYESRGMIQHGAENRDVAYFAGIADESYDHYAKRCRRHVIYLKEQRAFLLVDEFVAKPKTHVCFEWNIHTWHTISHTEDEFRIEAESELSPELIGTPLCRLNSYWTKTDGWEPPPPPEEDRRMQYNLRYALGDHVDSLRLPVVLRTGWKDNSPAKLEWKKEKAADTAVFDNTEVRVFHSGAVIASIQCANRQYRIGDSGLAWIK